MRIGHVGVLRFRVFGDGARELGLGARRALLDPNFRQPKR
jgi:hypothetical protein